MMCSRIAMLAVAAGLACVQVSPLGDFVGSAVAQSPQTGPTISRVSMSSTGEGVIEGTSGAGAHVALSADGRVIGKAIADQSGRWVVKIASGFAAGEHRIAVVARSFGMDRAVVGDEIRISVPVAASPAAPLDPRVAAVGTSEEQLRRAGALADAATRRFDELLPGGNRGGIATGTTPAPEMRVAQADTTKRAAPAAAPVAAAPAADDDFLAPLWDWLDRANRQYQNVIVKQLSAGEPADSLASPKTTRAPAVASVPAAAPPKASTPSAVVSQSPAPSPAPAALPAAPKGPVVAQQQPSQTPAAPQSPVATIPVAKAPVAPTAAVPAEGKDFLEQVQDSIQNWLDRANRQYQSVIVKRLSDPAPADSAIGVAQIPPVAPIPGATIPTPPTKAVEDAARIAEQRRREDEAARTAQTQAEAKRVGDAKIEADRRQAAENERRAAEARTAEAKKVADAKLEADRRAAEARTAEAKKVADAKLEADRRQAAENERRATDARTAEAKKVADAKLEADRRQAAENERRVTDARTAEAKKVADAKIEADRRQAAETERRAAEARTAEAKKVASAKAEIDRRIAADAKKVAEAKAEADRRQAVAATAAASAAAAAATRAAAKPASPPAVVSAVPAPKRVSVTRAVQPRTRFASTLKSKRRVASISSRYRSSLGANRARNQLKYAKYNKIKRIRRNNACQRGSGSNYGNSRSYVVKQGDTLWTIARLIYNDGAKYPLLVRANSDFFGNPNRIRPCQRIQVPRRSSDD